MKRQKENSERRKKRMVSRPVLVRSEKPGQVMSASYGRQQTHSIWKAA
ncbi:MAG TPA: hypothetical protein VEB40_14535 [Flavipsychrobacter sp.]|nr:hypothetical protein [Flavipsychrobacter sp.]